MLSHYLNRLELKDFNEIVKVGSYDGISWNEVGHFWCCIKNDTFSKTLDKTRSIIIFHKNSLLLSRLECTLRIDCKSRVFYVLDYFISGNYILTACSEFHSSHSSIDTVQDLNPMFEE